MSAWKPGNLGQRIVDPLSVEGTPACEKGVLVTEIPVLRTSPRHHERVRHQVVVPADEIASHRRQTVERTIGPRAIHAFGMSLSQVPEKAGKRLLAGSQKDGVGVGRGFLGQRGHVQSAKGHKAALGPTPVSDTVGAIGVGDVDLNDHEVGRVVSQQVQRLDVLVDEGRPVLRREIRGERGETERGKQRVFDGPPERARGLRQGWQDQLHTEWTNTLHPKVIFMYTQTSGPAPQAFASLCPPYFSCMRAPRRMFSMP